ncbi:hypothetical protein [Rosenbergiella nectarea]|uniref:hypothetical protein n=1 Tax=Rosenbergiella nectarea TaxID=988801 RepID=UPI001BDAA7AF|nr:hypothetical protein [Rosenbergiella nectarea]MBT0730302.1 hypothetical protein [Rosenbergiella nectarea subsp. apis]
MIKDLLVLRTNISSKYWEEKFEDLKDNFHIIVISDERENKVGFSKYTKIKFDIDSISSLNLMTCDDMQWRFGDYALYLADVCSPSYRYIWLIEPDVYFNKIEPKDFFSLYESIDTDLLTSYFEPSDKAWPWHSYKNELNVDIVYKSFFPLLRVSQKAINIIYADRVLLKTLANDESFFASRLIENKLTYETFDCHPDISYNKNTFSFRLPHFSKFVRGDSNIYHPVFHDLNGYINHLIKRESWKKIIKRIFGINNVD